MMRNKLSRSKKCVKDASCPSKDHPRTVDVITLVVSESSCSSDETSPGGDTAVAAAGTSTEVKPLQVQRTSLCTRDIKIAPIFLHAAQHGKRKRSSDGKLHQPVEKQQEAELPPQTEDVQLVKSQQHVSTVSHLTERRRSWRGQLSPSALHSCLEEIQTANPAFPALTVFNTLQRKASERQQDFGPTAENLSSQQNHLKEKRKWDSESFERMPKRLRSSLSADGTVGMGHCLMSAQGAQEDTVLTVKKQFRSNKLSRTYRLRQLCESPAGPVNNCDLNSGLINHTESQNKSTTTSDIIQRDSSFEDVLWTDKYSPLHSSEVTGNSASVNKLQSWLKKWKLRAGCDERRKIEERKQEENSSDSWDCGDFQGEAGAEGDREEPLCNTMLITGPPGVGKTAAVYACAQELGFKVFEVNCSSQRSGRHVLSQLKEATQSHLVEISGKDPLKPAYFNNYNINSCTPKSETLPGKTMRPKNVTSTSKKREAQKYNRKGKVNPAAVTLANYFKMKAKADHLHFGGPSASPSEKPVSKKLGNPSPGSDQTVPQNKKTATSLILFEEVDVIFDDDVGFLAAIKTFMTTTKRPVVLTTNDPSFKERFNCSLEEIVFKIPSAVNICSYLQLVGLAESVRLDVDDVSSLLTLSRGDIRRCLLQLQLWVHSGGGQASQSGGSLQPTFVQYLSVTERGDNVDSQLSRCGPGCTASMLGLHPVTLNHLQNLLKCQFWSEIDMMKLLRILAESWRGGAPLLYSNLEFLLPVGAKGTSVHLLDKGTCSGLQSELAHTDLNLHVQQQEGCVSPKVSATNSKSVRNISRLSRRKKYIPAVSHTTPSCGLTKNPQRTSLSSNSSSSSRDKSEQNAAKVATDCLDALTDFFDLMSYLDSTIPTAAAPLVSGSCRPEAFVWTGAEIKDGLLDEISEDEEVDRIWNQEKLLDIQAAVEGLGCHRCCQRVSEAWTEAQKYRQELGDARWEKLAERLTPPSSSRRQSLSFSFQPLRPASTSQRRYELSRMVLNSESFRLLGNRRAVSVDYMPILRYICRFQKEQQKNEEPVRCLNYLSSKHLGLSKSTIQLLAEDFS
ncbi:ATPase family AAA domain-containing protein 5b isoform X1 [Epinephelus lanceolatus]|uniref:ATPase family AAA domain-containing protein 5b isoform X1 n=1 Tax=Epinephelus lanceolatus TaxID=310571 RepID=UPI001444EB41|nr:ATPase family AAA domain-containing protein 5b isoform X1 [Epinephelus lanceolatus]